MPLEVEVYLQNIRVCCQAITECVQGKTLEDYLTSRMLRSAVERELSIVDEAVNQAVKLETALEQALSDSKRIIGFRNILIHNYARVSPELVWEITQVYIPKLLEEVGAELQKRTP